jgi:hypothetical protein
MTRPRHRAEGVQLFNTPRGVAGGSARDRRLRFVHRVARGDRRNRLWRAPRLTTSASHRPPSGQAPGAATNLSDCPFPAPGVSGAGNEWSRTTAPSASAVVSRGGLVRKPPSRDDDLTVKSVMCVFGTTRRAEDDCQHLSASPTIQHWDQSHRGETGSVALNGERPIHHRA